MNWKQPHIIKVYEAITAVADGRLELVSSTKAKCFSSSRNKYYIVMYDKDSNSFMSNDNSAYYLDTLSYPMIAMLIVLNEIPCSGRLKESLMGIIWKDVNKKFKDKDEGIKFVLESLKLKGYNRELVVEDVVEIFKQILGTDYQYLGKKFAPPVGL